MKIKSRLCIEINFFIFLLSYMIFRAPSLGGDELILGNADDWSGTKLFNLKIVPGRGGYLDLALEKAALQVDPDSTDLLLNFDKENRWDQSGRYILREGVKINQEYYTAGVGSGVFNRGAKVVLEQAAGGTLFSPNATWEDFSIEFWLYAANPKEGEYIIRWEGLGDRDGTVYSQSILVGFQGRQLVWSFTNFFQLPGNPFSFFEIRGDPLLPRKWSHHLLRYNSDTGMLEYLIDSVPADVLYTTETGTESYRLYTPLVGENPGELVIGEGFTGFIDELRIDRVFHSDRLLRNYDREGYGVSPLIDLGGSQSVLQALNPISSVPGDSALYIYYYITENLLEAERARQNFQGEKSFLDSNSRWRYFDNIDDSSIGRYLVLAYLLLPGMRADVSPSLSSLLVEYNLRIPPLAPTFVRAEREGPGRVKVSWSPSPSPGVEGYVVYFGERPGEYIYPNSPKVVEGGETMVYLEGLVPYKQYFMAIKTYVRKDSIVYSDFSQEISVRP